MKLNLTSRLRRNAAIIVAASAIGALGIGGVVSANADSSSPSPSQSTQQGTQQGTEQSDGDGEVPDAQESSTN
jgi:hypothetical protein